MAEKILSPGVFQSENDQSLVQRGIEGTAMAIIGPTVSGNPLVPTYVTSYSEYISKFGESFKSGSYQYEYFTSLAAKEFFNNGGDTLLVTRIISGSANVSTYASADIPSSVSAVSGLFASASFTASAPSTGSWVEININVPTVVGNVTYRLINYPYSTPGTNYYGSRVMYVGMGDGSGNANVTIDQWAQAVTGAINANTGGNTFYPYFTASYNSTSKVLTVSSKVAGTDANSYSITSSWYYNASTATASLFSGGSNGTSATSFTIETLAWGNQMNNTSSLVSGALASGSALNVRWEVTNVNTGSGTFTLAVRAGNDNNAQKNYLETWNNLSLDPGLPNYISRVVGDLKPVYKTDDDGNPYIDYTGSYANASQYIRVKSVTAVQPDSIDNNGLYKATQYSSSLPVLGSGSYGGSFNGGVAATNATPQFYENIGDGSSYSTGTSGNIQGFGSADYQRAIALLTNKDEYQFNVLTAPGVTLSTSAVSSLIACAEGRGDAIVPVDCTLYGKAISLVAATTNASGNNSNYAATYWPWVQVFSSAIGKPVWVPPTTVIGGVYAFNDQVGASWFAPAGLNRGGIPSVIRAERKLSQADRDTLYDSNVNPLATFPGEGVVVFGQKTLQKKSTALDRVNVRRLLIALKDYIGQVSRNLVFEQNTNVTRNRFLAQVNPFLESVVQRQGLYAYKVVMDDTNNTADVIDRNQLVGQIYIQPTKTAEFIILNYNIQPTGATFPA